MGAMSERKRRQVFEKGDHHCAYCGKTLEFEGGGWCPEHQVPLTRGGRNDLSNLVPACLLCNKRKRNRTPEEWRTALEVQFNKAIQQARDIAATYFDDGGETAEALDGVMMDAFRAGISFACDYREE